jgi:hypothetical protein
MAKSSSSRRWWLPKVLGGLAIAMIVGAFLSSAHPATGLRDWGLFLLVFCPLAALSAVVIHVLGPMRWRRRFATLAWCVVGGILGVPAAFSIAAAYENAHPQPLGPNVEDWRWAGALVRAEIAIAVGFALGFAFTLAICAWRESSGTARKTEPGASDLV